MNIIIFMFWVAVSGIVYAYFGYPIILYFLTKFSKRNKLELRTNNNFYPNVSIIIPFHNEENNLPAKIQNLFALNYPQNKLELILVSDGSNDKSEDIVKIYKSKNMHLFRVNTRLGKAAALNLGVTKAKNEIIVFTDASIMLEKDALLNIVQPFNDKKIGCVSGEDYIAENSGEGAYGKYELWLRNLESDYSSIVGASGSFYAQRKELVEPFQPGMAPDFLSVLNTVEKGFRAITNPAARGAMKSVKKTSQEFSRKVRTLIRGMEALFYKKNLLNVFKYNKFSFSIISHKMFRWFVPWLMLVAMVSNILLFNIGGYWQVLFYLQVSFYTMAVIASLKILNFQNTIPGKISLYFILSNLAILWAWMKYWYGDSQEIWEPSARN